MNEDIQWVDEIESDSDSIPSMDTDETLSQHEPDPLFVDAGDGVDDIFYIHPWEEEMDTRIPSKTTYLSVHHAQKMRDWWTRKIVEDVILPRTERWNGATNDSTHCYTWKFQLLGCSPRDPNRWQLVFPYTNETIWTDDRVAGEIKCEICYRGHYKGRCMVYLYLKSDSYQGGYNHIVGQYTRYLTEQELDQLHVIEN